MEKIKVQKKRIQVDMDETCVNQLTELQLATGSVSCAETIRALLNLGMLVRDEVQAGKDQLDLTAIRQFMFSRVGQI